MTGGARPSSTGVDTVATVGLAYGLKHVGNPPTAPGQKRFPVHALQDTAALAFAPAQFCGTAMAGNMAMAGLLAQRPSQAWSRVDAQKLIHW